MFLTDRQRVEILLPVQMMLGVVLAGANEENDAFKECVGHLLKACEEPVSDLLPSQQRKILNRVERLHREVSAPYTKDGAEVSKLGLIVFYWLQGLVDSGFFVFAAGSEVDQAVALFIPAIEHAAQVEAVDRSAQKQAGRMLEHLQSSGYYQGA